MLGMKGRRYKLWWSGKYDGIGGVGVMEELCQKVVAIRGVNDGDDYCSFLRGCAEVEKKQKKLK